MDSSRLLPTKAHLFTTARRLVRYACCGIWAGAVVLGPCRDAKAQQNEAESASASASTSETEPWHLGAEVITDLPVDVAIRLSGEGPYRLRLSTSFGFLPGPYVQLINAVVVEAGGYNQATADIIESALDTAFVWRSQLGWRFVPEWGFYADLGYSLVTLGGGLSGADLLGLAMGSTPPVNDPTRAFDVSSTLHLLVVEAGYEWTVLDDHLLIRTAVGFAGALGATTSIEPQFVPTLPGLVNAYANKSAAYLDDLYTSYVFTPTASVGVGYRFF